MSQAPERIRIVPDDYHVPWAGTAEDGRLFFLSQELFSWGADHGFVGLFLWRPDGTFDDLKIERVGRAAGLPPGQAVPAGVDDVVAARLAELGDYTLEPISVEPFTREVDGVVFGWAHQDEDGVESVHIEPGDFICYYEPWDGEEYDT